MTHDLGNGVSNAVRDDLQDGLRDVRRHKCEPTGAHDARHFILHGRNLVGGDVKVTEADREERGDVQLELHPVCTPELCVEHKVEQVQLDQRQDPVNRDLPLNSPGINWPLLILSSRNTEEGEEDRNEAIHVNCKEGESVNPLVMIPHESAKEIVGRSSGLALMTRLMVAHDEQAAVSSASLLPAPVVHFFESVTKRAGRGLSLFMRRARDGRRHSTMGYIS